MKSWKNQNEIIVCIAEFIRRHIGLTLNNTKYLCLIGDEVTDSYANKETWLVYLRDIDLLREKQEAIETYKKHFQIYSSFLRWTMCTLPLCFSLSVTNRAYKKQFRLKSNPSVDWSSYSLCRICLCRIIPVLWLSIFPSGFSMHRSACHNL